MNYLMSPNLKSFKRAVKIKLFLFYWFSSMNDLYCSEKSLNFSYIISFKKTYVMKKILLQVLCSIAHDLLF